MSEDFSPPYSPERIIRDILESLCLRDGLSLESDAEPGKSARNYELALRLGIGHVFGMKNILYREKRSRT